MNTFSSDNARSLIYGARTSHLLWLTSLVTVVVLAGALWPFHVFAQQKQPAPGAQATRSAQQDQTTKHPPLRIAIVDSQRVIFSVPEGIMAKKNLEKEFQAKQEALQKEGEEIQKLSQQLQNSSSVISEAKKKELSAEFQTKLMTFQKKEVQLRQEMRQKELQATQKITQKIVELAKQIAEEKNYFVVYEKSQSGLIYLKEYADITEDIILAYAQVPSTDTVAPGKQDKASPSPTKTPKNP